VISETLDAAVKESKVVRFRVNILSEIESSIGSVFMYLKTISTSQTKEYFGTGGLWLNIPAIG